MAKIEVVQPHEAEGQLKEIYDNIISSRGKIAEVHKIQRLNPHSIINHMELYQTIMFGQSPLKRVQREMLGVVVSKANNCEYCQIHHAEAVNHYWKDEERTNSLRANFKDAQLSGVDELMCSYAEELTKTPGTDTEQKYFEPLRNMGVSDREILDATLVISYFNFVNRIVLSLGVDVEENAGGYNY